MTRRDKAVFIVEIDEAELACRIVEGFLGMPRPSGQSAKEALAGMLDEDREAARRAASAAAEYLRDCVNKGARPS